MRTDSERWDWLEKQSGVALVNDDNGRWAVSVSGFASIEDIEEPGRFITDGPITWAGTAWVDRHEWRDSINAAIDAAMDEEEKRDD
jgi:hypothetical protein